MSQNIAITKINELPTPTQLLEDFLLVAEDSSIPQTHKTTIKSLFDTFGAMKEILETTDNVVDIYWTGAEQNPEDIVVTSFEDIKDFVDSHVKRTKVKINVHFPASTINVQYTGATDFLLNHSESDVYLFLIGDPTNQTTLNIEVTSATSLPLIYANGAQLRIDNFKITTTNSTGGNPGYRVIGARYNGIAYVQNVQFYGVFARAMESIYAGVVMCWGNIEIYPQSNNLMSVVASSMGSIFLNWGIKIENPDQNATTPVQADGIKISDGSVGLFSWGVNIKGVRRAFDVLRNSMCNITGTFSVDSCDTVYLVRESSSLISASDLTNTNNTNLFSSNGISEENILHSDGSVVYYGTSSSPLITNLNAQQLVIELTVGQDVQTFQEAMDLVVLASQGTTYKVKLPVGHHEASVGTNNSIRCSFYLSSISENKDDTSFEITDITSYSNPLFIHGKMYVKDLSITPTTACCNFFLLNNFLSLLGCNISQTVLSPSGRGYLEIKNCTVPDGQENNIWAYEDSYVEINNSQLWRTTIYSYSHANFYFRSATLGSDDAGSPMTSVLVHYETVEYIRANLTISNATTGITIRDSGVIRDAQKIIFDNVSYPYADSYKKPGLYYNTGAHISDANTPLIFEGHSGDTASRPANVQIGFDYFDIDLNKPIWWSGTTWVDATGTTV